MPHIQLHGASRLLKYGIIVCSNALQDRAIKKVMRFVMHSLSVAAGTYAHVPGKHRPHKRALLHGQMMKLLLNCLRDLN